MANVQFLHEIYKDLVERYVHPNGGVDRDLLSLAVQIQRNQILESALLVGRKEDTIQPLEKIAIELGGTLYNRIPTNE